MSVRTISPAELYQTHIAAGRPCRIIDVRTSGEYARLHAQGTMLVPLDRLDPRAFMAECPPDAGPLYVICQSGARAAKACEKFHAAGFSDVRSVQGGTLAWAQAGLPVVRGPAGTISLERQVRIGAGVLVLLSAVLGWLAHPLFFLLCALIGAGLIFAGLTGFCGMGLLLAKLPWNQNVPSCKA